MADTGTLLLFVDLDYNVKIGAPPKNLLDSFNKRATIKGRLKNISHVVCSPEGELFCVRGGDLFRGPLPSSKDVDWFSVARRVGKSEWSKAKCISFNPNGDLYVITNEGEFYKGPQPDNELESWLCDKAKKIGTGDWNQYETMFFDPDGNLYALRNDGKLYKGKPPTDESVQWLSSSTDVGGRDWLRLTHFMAISPDGKLWSVDKYNGNFFRGNPPTPDDSDYFDKSDYIGWNYNRSRFLAFTK